MLGTFDKGLERESRRGVSSKASRGLVPWSRKMIEGFGIEMSMTLFFTECLAHRSSGVPKNLRRGGSEYRTHIDLRRRRKHFAQNFSLVSEHFSPFLTALGVGLSPPRYAGA